MFWLHCRILWNCEQYIYIWKNEVKHSNRELLLYGLQYLYSSAQKIKLSKVCHCVRTQVGFKALYNSYYGQIYHHFFALAQRSTSIVPICIIFAGAGSSQFLKTIFLLSLSALWSGVHLTRKVSTEINTIRNPWRLVQ